MLFHFSKRRPVSIRSSSMRVDAKRRYEEARHLVGVSQEGVSENMEQLPRQGSSVEKHGSE